MCKVLVENYTVWYYFDVVMFVFEMPCDRGGFLRSFKNLNMNNKIVIKYFN